jgi:hypothetical protein
VGTTVTGMFASGNRADSIHLKQAPTACARLH